MGVVYLVTNKQNGKKYVGFTTKTLRQRKRGHFIGAVNPVSAFHQAINKYGATEFTWTILFTSSDKKLLVEKEILLIKKLKTKCPHGYNMTSGGEGIFECTEEVRSKLSKASRGRKMPSRSKEYREKLSNARNKLISSPEGAEFRSNLSRKRRELFASPEGIKVKQKISQGLLGRKFPEDLKAKLKTSRVKFLNSSRGEIYKKKLSTELTGRKLSLETRLKMGESRKGNKNAEFRKCGLFMFRR